MRCARPLLVASLLAGLADVAGEPNCLFCGAERTTSPCLACRYEAHVQTPLRRLVLAPPAPLSSIRHLAFYHGRQGSGPNRLAQALLRFKYGGDRASGHALARLVRRSARGIDEAFDLIVPIPLHPRRLRRRGYNQAAWLARAVALGTRGETGYGMLVKVADTVPQASRDARARRLGSARSFAVSDEFPADGRSVLLVDDVYTTGATISAAARALRRAGASRVGAFVLFIAERSVDEP